MWCISTVQQNFEIFKLTKVFILEKQNRQALRCCASHNGFIFLSADWNMSSVHSNRYNVHLLESLLPLAVSESSLDGAGTARLKEKLREKDDRGFGLKLASSLGDWGWLICVRTEEVRRHWMYFLLISAMAEPGLTGTNFSATNIVKTPSTPGMPLSSSTQLDSRGEFLKSSNTGDSILFPDMKLSPPGVISPASTETELSRSGLGERGAMGVSVSGIATPGTGVDSTVDEGTVNKKRSKRLLVLTSKYLLPRISFIARIFSSRYAPVGSTLDKFMCECMKAGEGIRAAVSLGLGGAFFMLRALAMLLFFRRDHTLMFLLSSATKKYPNLLPLVMQMIVEVESCGYACGPEDSKAMPPPIFNVATVFPILGLQETQYSARVVVVSAGSLSADESAFAVSLGSVGVSFGGTGRMNPTERYPFEPPNISMSPYILTHLRSLGISGDWSQSKTFNKQNINNSCIIVFMYVILNRLSPPAALYRSRCYRYRQSMCLSRKRLRRSLCLTWRNFFVE